MVAKEDFKHPFFHQDFDRKLTHTIFRVEYTGEWLVQDFVKIKDFLFYPQSLHNSKFSVVAPTSDQQEIQQGTVNLVDSVESLLEKKSFEDFLGQLHDICSDFHGEETDNKYPGIKYVFLTEQWEEEKIPDSVY